jgi:hypothetical protein
MLTCLQDERARHVLFTSRGIGSSRLVEIRQATGGTIMKKFLGKALAAAALTAVVLVTPAMADGWGGYGGYGGRGWGGYGYGGYGGGWGHHERWGDDDGYRGHLIGPQ